FHLPSDLAGVLNSARLPNPVCYRSPIATDGKSLVRRFYEELENEGRYEVADEVCDQAFRDVHNSSARGAVEGVDGVKRLAKVLHDEIGIRITIEDLIEEGDKVVARISSHTTYKGDF